MDAQESLQAYADRLESSKAMQRQARAIVNAHKEAARAVAKQAKKLATMQETKPSPWRAIIHRQLKARILGKREPVSPVESVRRSEARKRAAPWEGVGRRD